jgi:16S rRNA (guanine966-N2)-methyltransferase
MRIISGFYKGRKLDLPKNLTLRPTTDMAKESLFNVLRNLVDFDDVVALDLFSGTGSISFELSSRGAKSVLAVENSGQQIRFIESIIQKLKMENMRILRMDVFQFFKTNKQSFDLIFADPPFDMPELETIADLIFSNKMLKTNGIFVLEHPKHSSFSEHPNFFDHRNYGSVNFSFFKNKEKLAE